eukprot:Tamp_36397.p1 GENE.Tamp_36397~~Tamp_36397.p1  ORF type:complete len:109 (+),score=1.75 Tamp_36397:137-463(+)
MHRKTHSDLDIDEDTAPCTPPHARTRTHTHAQGPILCITKVKGSGEAGDAEAVRLANACDFALSSCAFSRCVSVSLCCCVCVCAFYLSVCVRVCDVYVHVYVCTCICI